MPYCILGTSVYTGSDRAVILVSQGVCTVSFNSLHVKSLFWTYDSLPHIAYWQREPNAQAAVFYST